MAGRKIIRPALWPTADRKAWAAALDDGDIFDGRGPAARWSQGTRRSVAAGYGRWIGYLAASAPDCLAMPPAARVTRPRVQNYVDHLRGEVSEAGLFNYLKHLYDAIRVMDPHGDWTWLKTTVWRLNATVVARSKRSRMVDPERLLALGVALMTNAESQLTAPALAGPICYRDGLIIGFLALRPIRRRNLAAMRLGQHLVPAGAGWQVIFEADETKTHQPLEFQFPPLLQPFLERYLAEVRPRFPGSEQHDGLWASAKACPLGGDALYQRVSIRTQEAFGRPINLHLFRDIAVTAIATKAPERIGMARDLLGHSTLSTLDRHYNQAQQIEAGRAYQAAVLALREENDHHRPGRTKNRR